MSKPVLSKEQEEEIQKLNQMTQQLRALQQQQYQIETQKNELSRTVKLLETLPEDQEIFRQTGQILFKADVTATLKDMTEKLELIEIRVKQSTKQIEDYQQATQNLDNKVRGYLRM